MMLMSVEEYTWNRCPPLGALRTHRAVHSQASAEVPAGIAAGSACAHPGAPKLHIALSDGDLLAQHKAACRF